MRGFGIFIGFRWLNVGCSPSMSFHSPLKDFLTQGYRRNEALCVIYESNSEEIVPGLSVRQIHRDDPDLARRCAESQAAAIGGELKKCRHCGLDRQCANLLA